MTFNLTEGISGTYTASVPATDESGTAPPTTEQGTIVVNGSILTITRPQLGQRTWPWSVDGDDLTLSTNLGDEIYRKR